MHKIILITAAFLGVIGITLGAFAAHSLKPIITTEALQTFETGVRYQMYHAFFLLFVGNSSYISLKTKQIIYGFTVTGVLFFSVSIYGLATNSLTSFDFKTVGFITPIGGLCLIVSWVFALKSFMKKEA